MIKMIPTIKIGTIIERVTIRIPIFDIFSINNKDILDKSFI